MNAICKTDSKKHCMACEHYDYCDKANRCDGRYYQGDDDSCENNPLYTNADNHAEVR